LPGLTQVPLFPFAGLRRRADRCTLVHFPRAQYVAAEAPSALRIRDKPQLVESNLALVVLGYHPISKATKVIQSRVGRLCEPLPGLRDVAGVDRSLVQRTIMVPLRPCGKGTAPAQEKRETKACWANSSLDRQSISASSALHGNGQAPTAVSCR
jgi:hypothetical protein